jgi:hypothetical protein
LVQSSYLYLQSPKCFCLSHLTPLILTQVEKGSIIVISTLFTKRRKEKETAQTAKIERIRSNISTYRKQSRKLKEQLKRQQEALATSARAFYDIVTENGVIDLTKLDTEDDSSATAADPVVIDLTQSDESDNYSLSSGESTDSHSTFPYQIYPREPEGSDHESDTPEFISISI